MKQSWSTPDLPGVLTSTEINATADWIASLQTGCGFIRWHETGHGDPWNHVEAAMALATAGRVHEAERAYAWLLNSQRPDGSWYNYYVQADCGALFASDTKLDSNVCAYVATGVWHHWLLTADRGFLETMWPVVDRAMAFVRAMTRADGAVVWARYGAIEPWSYALVTGSASIVHSLRCASSIAAVLGHDRPEWETASDRLASLVRSSPAAFESKDRWSMDWYYPVLTGVVTGLEGLAQLRKRYDEFELDGKGIRCVSDQPWITAAETCECAIAHASVGESDIAMRMLTAAQRHRCDDGSYVTGLVYPDGIQFPAGERTSYTAAAAVLAADALRATTPAWSLFVNHPGA